MRSIFEASVMGVPTFLHHATTPPASITRRKKIPSRAQHKLYIIRRGAFLSTIAAILPIIYDFADNFVILPIEKQAQARSLLTFFTYFTYFTNKKVLHRIHKKNYGNMILPVLSVKSVKYG